MQYKRLLELRKKAKLTQATVGKILGVSTRAYTHYEVGDRDIPPRILVALADYYGVSVDYLLDRTTCPDFAPFKLSVAIDGPAGAGKSSIAKAAAERLGFVYVDTGALYRTVALYLLDHGVDPADAGAVEAALPQIQVDLAYTPEGQKMFLCGEDVTGRIRTPEVSMATSTSSAVPAVRAFLLELQRELARKNSVLMDGRDIGTVVLPHAQLKVFLTASPEERARRRCRQMEQAGQKADYDSILRDIILRDYQDSHREAAPLKQAEDALLLDTSDMSLEESVERLVSLVRERLQHRASSNN